MYVYRRLVSNAAVNMFFLSNPHSVCTYLSQGDKQCSSKHVVSLLSYTPYLVPGLLCKSRGLRFFPGLPVTQLACYPVHGKTMWKPHVDGKSYFVCSTLVLWYCVVSQDAMYRTIREMTLPCAGQVSLCHVVAGCTSSVSYPMQSSASRCGSVAMVVGKQAHPQSPPPSPTGFSSRSI